MATNYSKTPQFQREQRVCFIGGVGTVRNCHRESDCWSYLVEMDMGPVPEMGRIGYETTVRLFECDLTSIDHEPSRSLAIA